MSHMYNQAVIKNMTYWLAFTVRSRPHAQFYVTSDISVAFNSSGWHSKEDKTTRAGEHRGGPQL